MIKYIIAAFFVGICFFAIDASAAVSMQNVTTETTTVRTWLVIAGAIAIAVAILVGLYMAAARNPVAGVAVIVITVVCATLFAAALI